jgi:type I restriction enzyme S subunit
MSFKGYSNYKSAHVEWLGEIPSHWSTRRVKDTTYLKGRVGWKGLSSDEYRSSGFALLVTGTDFQSKYIDWNTCHWVDEERYSDDPFIQLQNGDLLITKDGTIGKLAIVLGMKAPACLNSGIFLLRPLESAYDTEFMYWVLSSNAFSVFCDLSSFGSTIQHLYQNVFERFVFPAPPYREQQEIAAFLSRETRKIDALVVEQEKLIELLKEKRQAAISHAVTKGIDPSVPMKDSGIDWLGRIPASWKIASLKHAFSLLKDGTHLPPARVDTGVPLLSVRNISDSKFSLREDDSHISEESYYELCKAFVPNEGDVLLAIVGATIGKVALVPPDIGRFHIQRSLAIFRPNSTVLSSWVYYYFQSDLFQKLLWSEVGYSAQPGIYLGALGSFPMPIPSRSEQAELCQELDRALVNLDALLEEANRATLLLREYRAALISDAVTGKIDVRGLIDEKTIAKTPEAA